MRTPGIRMKCRTYTPWASTRSFRKENICATLSTQEAAPWTKTCCASKIRYSPDAIAFIYPVFWTEAPAKLVGWFDRVWTFGFAYGPATKMKKLKKALVIAIAGNTMEALKESGEAQAMETVMLGDRIRDRAEEKRMVILYGTSRHDMEQRESKAPAHLKTAYELGRDM